MDYLGDITIFGGGFIDIPVVFRGGIIGLCIFWGIFICGIWDCCVNLC